MLPMDESAPYSERLKTLRDKIDEIDSQLVQLFNERARVAQKIGELKREAKETTFDPPREEAILRRVSELTRGPLRSQEIRAIFSLLIRLCRSLEQVERVAYLGPEGTFSHQVILEWFGPHAAAIAAREIPEIAQLLKMRLVNLALFPVENSSEGIVGISYDLIAEHRFRILRELILPIHIYLVGRVELKGARRLYSHVQPFRQAYGFVQESLPQVEWVETRSSAEAAHFLRNDPEGVALVSPLVAESGEFPVIAGPIETQPCNETRFWVVDRGEGAGPSEAQKSTLYFILPHRPGTLARILGRLARSRINLTSIVSRPFPGRPWEYRFFIDLEGDALKEPLASLIQALERDTVELRILGSYTTHRLQENAQSSR